VRHWPILVTLNSMICADNDALNRLLEHEELVNEHMEKLPNVWVRETTLNNGGTAITAMGLINAVITSSDMPRICVNYRETRDGSRGKLACFHRYRPEKDPLSQLLRRIEMLMNWCVAKSSLKHHGQRIYGEYISWPLSTENAVLKRFMAAAGTMWHLGADSAIREPEDTEKTGVLRTVELTFYVERLVNGKYEQIGTRWLDLDKHTFLDYIDQMSTAIESHMAIQP
jgi:hypothetical protein